MLGAGVVTVELGTEVDVVMAGEVAVADVIGGDC